MRLLGLVHPAKLKEDLAFQLPEVRIVRLLGQERVHPLQRLVRLLQLVVGDRPRQAGRIRRVLLVVLGHGDVRIDEAVELGLHHLVLGHRLGAVDLAVVRQRGHPVLQGLDAIRGERVVDEILVAAILGEHFLVAVLVEKFRQAAT